MDEGQLSQTQDTVEQVAPTGEASHKMLGSKSSESMVPLTKLRYSGMRLDAKVVFPVIGKQLVERPILLLCDVSYKSR